MKHNNKFIAILIAFISFSCNDAIDIQQPGLLLEENAFQNVEDLNQGLYGAYSSFDYTTEILANAVFTDEITLGFVNGGQNRDEYSLALTPASGIPYSLWVRYYGALANINNLIAASNNITPTNDELDEYNAILGQAYALRAFAHFQIQTYFTTDYTDDSALGGIMLNYVPEIGEEIARNTNGEVFSFIDSDLTLADTLLSDDLSDPTLVNKDFVLALRARMAAYRGQYSTAKNIAEDLLSRYPIANQSDYENIWNDTSNAEIIFKLERTENDIYDNQATGGGGTVGSLFAFINSTYNGSPFMELDRNLFNSYNSNDVRLDVMIDPSSIISADYQNAADYKQEDVLVIKKYAGSENVNLMNDLKIFRSSEMLFIVAEAEADAGQLNNVATLIKEIRDARLGSAQSLPNYSDATEAYADILSERRKELALEGHRWVDIKRLGVKANKTIEREPLDCAQVGVCSINNTDYRFTLPIPLQELDVNSLLTQNSGY